MGYTSKRNINKKIQMPRDNKYQKIIKTHIIVKSIKKKPIYRYNIKKKRYTYLILSLFFLYIFILHKFLFYSYS